MDYDASFVLKAGHIARLQALLQRATRPDVSGRWQARPVSSWKDAWENLSQCLDMAEGRAGHEEEYEQQETMRCLNALLLRAIHWLETPESMPMGGELVSLHCKMPGWDEGGYQSYEQQMRGYHFHEFSAAVMDAGTLLAVLREQSGFEREVRWLQTSLLQLEATQQSMLRGLAQPKEEPAHFAIELAKLTALKDILWTTYGTDAETVTRSIREALWTSAVRCAEGNLREDMLHCLRVQRFLSAAFLPQALFRALPETPAVVVIPVHVPARSNDWYSTHCEAGAQCLRLEQAYGQLSDVAHHCKSSVGAREAAWLERAGTLIAGTQEMLRLESRSPRRSA